MSTPATTTSSPSSATTNPIGRTLVFAGAAVACLAVTAGIEYASHPAPIKEFGLNGQEFYPEFRDPTLASSLEVYGFDTEEVMPQEFVVQRMENGRWSIPSRHNYPADAEDQLAKTASSVIGIVRGAMVTRWPAEHASYGVVNPKQKSLKVDEVEGVGKRLILRGEDNAVLVDYIIGKQTESEQSDEYYVRHPEEDEVYIASLSIDLSTKFTDWIDTDLLHINQSDLRQLTINDYVFDELQGTLTNAETSVLKREKSSDPWVLDGLDEETEEVDKDAMREATNAVADMKIVGVRPKRPGLSPELTLDRDAVQSQNDVQRLQNDLMSRGFLLQPDKESDSLKLIAREGELYAATDDGLIYRMHFGRAFTGTQDELEFGLSAEGAEETEEKASEDAASEDAAGEDAAGEDTSEADGSDEAGANEDDESDSSQPGRYVFVRVEFDEGNLGERPVEPVAPEMPEELKQAAEEEAAAGTDAAEDSADNEEAASEEDGESDSESEDDSDEAEEDPLEAIRKEFETAQKDYELDKMTYDNGLEEFEKKVEDGQKKAEDLNRRFAEWYYVVSGETFDKLRLSRKNIVKVKEEEETEDSDTDEPSNSSQTSDAPAEEASEADADAPDADAPDAVDSKENVDSSDESADVTEDAAAEEPSEEEPSEDPAEDGSTETLQDTPSGSEPTGDAQ